MGQHLKLGFLNSGPGIGDQVVYSSLAENYFRNTGRKLVDIKKSWVYDHNPFVERNVPPDEVIDLWKLKLGKRAYPNLAQRISEGLGLPKTYLRHPRLYQFENDEIDPNAVVVHVTGISGAAAGMPDHVIDHISKKYRNSVIFQIGGPKDKNTPFIDRRGLPLWDSIRLIATSGTFIGVNSGPMNIANCYPGIRKKLVLLKRTHDSVPVSPALRWIDFNWEYFNTSPDDEGITMSYLKL